MQKILLVDDQKMNIEYMSRQLSTFFECELYPFLNPIQALKWLESNEVDLALIDYHMPELSGVDLIKEIRRQPLHKNVPLVIISSDDRKLILSEAFDVGASDYFKRPYEKLEFMARIQNLLSLRKMTLKLEADAKDLNQRVKKATADLHESEQRFRLALDGTRDGIWDWDLRTGEIFYSSNWCKMLGYEKEEVPTLPDFWMGRVHTDDAHALTTAIDNHVLGKSDIIDFEYRLQHRNKKILWVHIKGKAVRDNKGMAIRIVGAQSDVTDVKTIQNQLTYNALHDTLTNLPNRALFNERLNQAFLRFKRNQEEQFAVLFIDLDYFKDINDSYGHSAGDQVLVEITKILTSCTREVDTVSRIGGDEFVILLEDTATETEVQFYLDRLYEASQPPVHILSNDIKISFSIGVVFVHGSHQSYEPLLKEADEALYQAKEKGRGRAVFYRRETGAFSPRRREIQKCLATCLAHNEMVIYYQPIICLTSQKTLGYEALLRWHHPTMGIIDPEDFIPVAEKNDVIIELGTFVMEGAMKQLSIWQKKYKNPDLFMCINVTAAQVFQRGYLALLKETCVNLGVLPDQMILEFSEISFSEIYKWNALVLTEIKNAGFHIALDDYGEGRASIRSIVDYQMDFLKIDRSLSLDVCTDERKRRLFDFMIHLGLESNFQIIVEGIETPQILNYVIGSKAQMGQGHLFSKPCPPQVIEDCLKQKA